MVPRKPLSLFLPSYFSGALTPPCSHIYDPGAHARWGRKLTRVPHQQPFTRGVPCAGGGGAPGSSRRPAAFPPKWLPLGQVAGGKASHPGRGVERSPRWRGLALPVKQVGDKSVTSWSGVGGVVPTCDMCTQHLPQGGLSSSSQDAVSGSTGGQTCRGVVSRWDARSH